MSSRTNLSVGHISLARGYKGNERQTELLIKELSNLGVPQTLVCRDDSPLPYHLEGVKGLKILRIAGLTDPRFLGHFRFGRRCSILHAHETHGLQWCFVHYMLFGTPYILTRRKVEDVSSSFMNRTVYSSASGIVAISKYIKENLEKQFGKKCELIGDCSSRLQPNYQVVQRFREALKNRFVVGNVGPLINREKAQSVLIDAARELKTKIPELVLVFVGGGDDTKQLRAYADGMPNVKFVGFKRNIVDYIASFDVFAYPANKEGIGSILLDVMEQGVPIVASKVDGIPDIVKHGETGLLIEKGDHQALAEALLRLKRDPGLRRTLVDNGLNEAEMHNSAAMAADYYRLYVGILNGDYSNDLPKKS